MKIFSNLLKSVAFAAVILASLPAQANLIERILANPKIQALIGKPAEVTNMLGLCKNTSYQRANQQACTDAAQAEMVLKLPFEMRTVMNNANSAKSMRDLCLAAQNTIQKDSYLCNELAKADKSFGDALAAERSRGGMQPGEANASN